MDKSFLSEAVRNYEEVLHAFWGCEGFEKVLKKRAWVTFKLKRMFFIIWEARVDRVSVHLWVCITMMNASPDGASCLLKHPVSRCITRLSERVGVRKTNKKKMKSNKTPSSLRGRLISLFKLWKLNKFHFRSKLTYYFCLLQGRCLSPKHCGKRL